MANLGYIGLGVGSQIAGHLMAKGHTMTGYNRTRSKVEALIERGMVFAETPREACAAADIIITQVTDFSGDAGCCAWAGWFGRSGPGKVLVDMGTNSPVGAVPLLN